MLPLWGKSVARPELDSGTVHHKLCPFTSIVPNCSAPEILEINSTFASRLQIQS